MCVSVCWQKRQTSTSENRLCTTHSKEPPEEQLAFAFNAPVLHRVTQWGPEVHTQQGVHRRRGSLKLWESQLIHGGCYTCSYAPLQRKKTENHLTLEDTRIVSPGKIRLHISMKQFTTSSFQELCYSNMPLVQRAQPMRKCKNIHGEVPYKRILANSPPIKHPHC